MRITRAARHQQFEILPTDFLRDKKLSYRARGVGARILSNKDGYACTSLTLADESSEGKHAVRSALQELRARRYLVTYHRQDDRGRWQTWSIMHDQPQPEIELCGCKRCSCRGPKPENQPSAATETRFPEFGPPAPGVPESGDRAVKSSNTSSTTKITTTIGQDQLCWPTGLKNEDKKVVVEEMEKLEIEQQQVVVDLLGEQLGKGRRPTHLGKWVARLAAEALAGRLVVTPWAADAAQGRARRAAEAREASARQAEAAARAARAADPVAAAKSKAAALAAFEEFKRSLSTA